jgi:hypothetical protein
MVKWHVAIDYGWGIKQVVIKIELQGQLCYNYLI